MAVTFFGESWATWTLAVLGISITWFVSRYYALKSLKRIALGARLLGCHRVVLKHSDFSSQLEVRYKDRTVNELFQSNVIIGNCGNVGLKGEGCPLRILVTEDVDVIGVELQHVHPKARRIDISHEADSEGRYIIIIEFDILNRNEFILLQLLTDGPLRREKMKFEISAPDLPPELDHNYLKMDWLVRNGEPSTFKEAFLLDWKPMLGIPIAIFIALGSYKYSSIIDEIDYDNYWLNIIKVIAMVLVRGITFISALTTIGFIMYLSDQVPWRRILMAERPKFKIPEGIGLILPDDAKQGFQSMMGDESEHGGG